ncbi:MAG: hypothetical protein AAB328_03430 [candidate division NC10 bacterium]
MFRAILLGCLEPAGTDIMEEFYTDHYPPLVLFLPNPVMGK